MKRIAISFIGTGKYLNFFPKYYETLSEYFVPECEKVFFLFTDGEVENLPIDVELIYVDEDQSIENSDYKSESWYELMRKSIGGLRRFETINNIKNKLIEFDWFVFIDADMFCCDRVIKYEDFFNDEKDFFGIQHPTYSKHWKNFVGYYPFERDEKSLSCVKIEEEVDDIYLQGCIWGGKVPQIFTLLEELNNRINEDIKNHVLAIAHDESHLNRYRIENIDNFHILSPEYATPGNIPLNEFDFSPRMIHSPTNKKEILLGIEEWQ